MNSQQESSANEESPERTNSRAGICAEEMACSEPVPRTDAMNSPEQRLRLLYAELDAAVLAAKPLCVVSGRCCRFEEYGHTLFVSNLEARELSRAQWPAENQLERATCPFQVGNLCTARQFRPLGCRLYYCDPLYAERQVELGELFLKRLKALHDEVGEPWHYRPLYDALADLAPVQHSDDNAG